jgi:Family of unknown function (DUF6064)
MTEWWTYRLSDLLMFSARTYYRMFELYNAEVWPGQFVALGAGLAIVVLCSQRNAWAARAACALLAASWLWVAWAFHAQRYAQINWAAISFAAAFAAEGALLLLRSAIGVRARMHDRADPKRVVGFGLLWFALVVQPLLGPLVGRPWQQIEVFGLAPDPTALFTLGLLLLLQPNQDCSDAWTMRALAWVLWPIPLAWCLASAATLWTLSAPDAWLMPCAAVLALFAARRAGADR